MHRQGIFLRYAKIIHPFNLWSRGPRWTNIQEKLHEYMFWMLSNVHNNTISKIVNLDVLNTFT